jgi:glycosyltransferase involved in cell wall biosynthesis
MKILYTITKSEEGGAQTHVYQLVKYFFSLGHEVVVMSAPGGWLENKIKDLGVKFVSNKYFANSFNPLNCFWAMTEIKKLVQEWQPDIIHCHSTGAGFFTRVAIRNKIPTVYTAHGWGFNIGVPIWQKFLAILGEKVAGDFTEKLICVSEFVKNLGEKYYVVSKDKLVLIHNGVEDFSSLEKVSHDNDKKIKIIFVGRLARPKLPILFLRAVNRLPLDIKKKVEIIIIGAGPKLESIANFIKEMEMDNVKLLGGRDRKEVISLILQSDIFILLSRWEGLPLTILEAMSVGLPIIASEVGGITEAVDGSNGILVKNDLEEVKLALAKIINNEDLRKKMGDSSRFKYREKFSLSEMLTKTEKVYQMCHPRSLPSSRP